MEWVDVLQSWKAIENCLKLLGECLCRIFDLSGVESSDSRDLEAGSNLCGQSPLSTTEDYIDELLRSGHRRDLASISS